MAPIAHSIVHTIAERLAAITMTRAIPGRLVITAGLREGATMIVRQATLQETERGSSECQVLIF
jgi:hypothetical protein